MSTKDLFAEGFVEEPYWWRDARPVEAIPDALPDTVDAVVVGSGYAGLSCALELARAGTDVLVLDAGPIGGGASSRAAGFLSGRAGVGKQTDLTKMLGAEKAEEVHQEADDAYQHLQRLIAEHQIDCGFAPVGRFVGAHTPKAYTKLAQKKAEYDDEGDAKFEMVPLEKQHDYVASDYWYGGLFLKDAGTIHPAQYHKGLYDLCAAAGVKFASHTRLLGVGTDGAWKRLNTDRGPISAREVMLGTNGYTDSASPWHQRRLMPIASMAVATVDLGEDVVKAILPKLCPIIDTKRIVCFARPTPDNKAILFGGRARFASLDIAEGVQILHRQAHEMLPDLAGVQVTHAWSGNMAFTFDFLPKVGIHEGIHYALGCNAGCGIVMMSWLGRHAGRRILGTNNKPSVFEELPYKTMPMYSGKPWFLPIVGNWWRLRDWAEIKLARMAA